jgi:hypothetical protein
MLIVTCWCACGCASAVQVVVDRMFKRVLTFAGLPVALGMVLFPVFWYLKVSALMPNYLANNDQHSAAAYCAMSCLGMVLCCSPSSGTSRYAV